MTYMVWKDTQEDFSGQPAAVDPSPQNCCIALAAATSAVSPLRWCCCSPSRARDTRGAAVAMATTNAAVTVCRFRLVRIVKLNERDSRF